MYKVEGAYKYACQMCHEPVAKFEKCQISTGMEKELDPMYLCMCPNCATEYRQMRLDEYELNNFLNRIMRLGEKDINSQDPVKIDFGNESIWFTQTHIAEIREMMSLKKEADNYGKTPSGSTKKTSANIAKMEQETEIDPEADITVAGTDVYKSYIGKRVFHKTKGYGVVRECDGTYLGIEFEKGDTAGKIKKYSLEICLSKGLITIV